MAATWWAYLYHVNWMLTQQPCGILFPRCRLYDTREKRLIDELVELEPNRDALVSGDTGWDMRHVPCPKCSMLLWMLSY
jgi:hypothetical protein